MILLPNYTNAKIAVFGLGISGLSTIRAVLRSGGTVLAWDDKDSAREWAQIELEQFCERCQFTSPREYNWSGVSALVVSPGIPTTFPSPHWVVTLAREHGCPIKCDIELFLEAIHHLSTTNKSSKPRVIGVTGTNGKSTTTALTGFMLNQLGIDSAIGGNIGIPALDLAVSKKVYVLELSSFQIELLSTSMINSVIDVAILLNLTPDHIDRHGTFENYALAKERLLVNTRELAIICTDSKETLETYAHICQDFVKKGSRCILKTVATKSKDSGGASACLIGNELFYTNSDGSVLPHRLNQPDFKINLNTNAQNIASAYTAVAHLLPKFFPVNQSEKLNAIIDSIKPFPGLPHRAQLVGSFENIELVNDSKSTNADSSEKTLLSFESIFWILGGKPKEGGINSLVKDWKVSLCKIKKIFLIGESSEEFAYCLSRNTELDFVRCNDLETAFRMSVQEAEKLTEKITILLSPACASFDQWKNFEARGEGFRKLALEYIDQRKNKISCTRTQGDEV